MSKLGIVLCVRIDPKKLPESNREQLRLAFPDYQIEFMYVNPMTPEDLDWYVGEIKSGGVVAVYLQERPLPTVVMEKGEIPCIVPTPDGLKRLVRINPVFEDLSTPSPSPS